jgi:hypothetical protein
MSRERCLFCDRFLLDGEDITRPISLGLAVHRHCYLRDAGLDDVARRSERDAGDSEESDGP